MGSDYEDSGSEELHSHHKGHPSAHHGVHLPKNVSEEEDTMMEREDDSEEELSDEEDMSPIKDEHGNELEFDEYNPLLHFAKILKAIRDSKKQ